MPAWYFTLLERRPWLLALAALLLALISAAGLPQLRFTADYRAFFGPDNPELRALEELERNFARAETLLITVAPASGVVFNAATLGAVRELTERGAGLPYARGAVSLTNFFEARATADGISAEPLIPDGPLDALDFDELRRRALAEPRLLHGLIPPAADVTMVIVSFELPHERPAEEIRAVAGAARALAADVAARHPGLAMHLTGIIMFNDAMQEAIVWDMTHLYPTGFVLMFVLLLAFYRGLSATLATMAVIGLSVLTTFGAAGALGITLTTASITCGVIVLTLAVADSVHIVTTFKLQRAAGLGVDAALVASLRTNGLTVFLTTFTTALGALGMNFGDSPPFRDLGNLVAIGVVAAWLYALTLLPVWLRVAPPPPGRVAQHSGERLRALADFVARHRNPVLAISLAVTLAAALFVPRNRFDDNYAEFFRSDFEFRQATEFTNRRLTGMQYIEYGLPAGTAADVFEPQYLARLAAFVDWLRAQPEVVKVSSLIDLMKRLNQAMLGGDAGAYRLPQNREQAAQYLLFYEMSLPSGMDLTHLVNMDKSATRITVQLRDTSSGAANRFDTRVREWQSRELPESMRAPGSGIALLFDNIARRNFQSMISGTVATYLLIAAVLWWLFGSARLALITLVPNTVPVLLGFGIWGALVGKLAMSLSVVVSLTIGIVVDDTVHLLAHYARARREQGMDAAAALREAFGNAGPALALTTAVLIGGFGVLMGSGLILSAHLGALTVLIIVLALACDFLLLPALLLWLDRPET